MSYFIPSVSAPKHLVDNLTIVVSEGRLLAPSDQCWQPLSTVAWQALSWSTLGEHFLGYLGDSGYRAVDVPMPLTPPEGYEWVSLRAQVGVISDPLLEIAGSAVQIVNWHKGHRFCGSCGRETEEHPQERAKVCGACHTLYFPRLSPCIITVITRGQECLLAHNANFAEGYYSALAGFIEAGETAEATLHREVMEEVGLKVKNLRYFGSQSWPFPGQLMLGFHAEYDSGDICVDGEEIVDARWCRYDQLPLVPNSGTLSGRLIAEFVERFVTS